MTEMAIQSKTKTDVEQGIEAYKLCGLLLPTQEIGCFEVH